MDDFTQRWRGGDALRGFKTVGDSSYEPSLDIASGCREGLADLAELLQRKDMKNAWGMECLGAGAEKKQVPPRRWSGGWWEVGTQ